MLIILIFSTILFDGKSSEVHRKTIIILISTGISPQKTVDKPVDTVNKFYEKVRISPFWIRTLRNRGGNFMLSIMRSTEEISYFMLTAVYEESLEKDAHDRYEYAAAAAAFHKAAQDLYSYLRTIFFATPGAALAVWQENGAYKSVLRLEPHLDGMLVAAMETAPDARGKGYATALLKGVLEQWPATVFYSHIRKDNAASLRCHLNCGFQIIREDAVFLDGSIHPECFTLKYE